LIAGIASPLAAQAPDRSTRPALGPVPTLDLPEPRRFTLSNGLEVVVLEKHDVPLVQVNLQLRAGGVRDPDGRYGLASLTAEMLDEGAAGRSALELADAFEMLGARFGTNAGVHMASVSLRVPVARLSEAIDLMGDVVRRPDLPAQELERLRAEWLTTLIRRHDEPGAIAGALFDETLFGEGHAYGRDADEASIRAFTVADVRAFHERFYRPDNATMVVVGAIDADAARPVIETAFGGWQRGEQRSVAAIPEAQQIDGRTIYLVDKPGAVQSVVVLGRIGVARSNPDVYALEVLNTILGGSFTSRLNQNLREDKGYTYGASSGFDFGIAPGAFSAGASVQTQSTGPALAEFMKELNGILEPIQQDEVDRAKNFLAMGFIQGFQATSQIAAQLADIVEHGLPPDYLDRYVARILAVTRADVERVARTYLDPANLAIVVVGDRAQVEDQIRALELGPIHILRVTDVLGPIPVVGRPTSRRGDRPELAFRRRGSLTREKRC
jgi:predicted Zn-dependent peptidase